MLKQIIHNSPDENSGLMIGFFYNLPEEKQQKVSEWFDYAVWSELNWRQYLSWCQIVEDVGFPVLSEWFASLNSIVGYKDTGKRLSEMEIGFVKSLRHDCFQRNIIFNWFGNFGKHFKTFRDFIYGLQNEMYRRRWFDFLAQRVGENMRSDKG